MLTNVDTLHNLFIDVFEITDMFIRDKDAVKYRDLYENKLAVLGKEIASINVSDNEKVQVMNSVIMERINNKIKKNEK